MHVLPRGLVLAEPCSTLHGASVEWVQLGPDSCP